MCAICPSPQVTLESWLRPLPYPYPPETSLADQAQGQFGLHHAVEVDAPATLDLRELGDLTALY